MAACVRAPVPGLRHPGRVIDQEERSTAPAVVGAVAVGVAPLPFLAVYAGLFIAHGTFSPVIPPDITSSKQGELIAGIIAAVLFVIGVLSVAWLLNGRGRWLFLLAQAATLGTAIDFIVDETKGPTAIPWLLVVSSVCGLALGLSPAAARHVRERRGERRQRSNGQDTHAEFTANA